MMNGAWFPRGILTDGDVKQEMEDERNRSRTARSRPVNRLRASGPREGKCGQRSEPSFKASAAAGGVKQTKGL
jgi:hypothetical protein